MNQKRDLRDILSLSDKLFDFDDATLARQRAAFEAAQKQRHDPSIEIAMLKAYIARLPIDDITDKTFAKFAVTKENEHLYNVMSNWLPGEKGILIYGDPGTGKTHLVKSVIAKYCSRGYRMLFTALASFFDDLKASFDDLDYTMAKYKTIDFLAIDDLGAEKATEWSEEKLCQLLDYRIRNNKTTFVTTNLKFIDLKNKYHYRTVDRLMELTVFYELRSPSYRAIIQQREQRALQDRRF